MFKKRSKKALSHVDWAMSLGIFLLYLAWYFVLVKPLFAPSGNVDTLLDILQDGFEDEVYQEVERVRMMVPGSLDSGYEPIVIPFAYDWSGQDIAHSADHFYIDDGKMFFLANLSGTDTFSMYHPHDAIVTSPLRPVFASDSGFSSGDFTSYFDGFMLDRVYFMGDQRLSGFSVEVDDTEIDDEGSFTDGTFLAKYRRDGDHINLTSYVFAENPKVFMYLRPDDYQNHSVVVSFAAYNYTRFYLDALSRGELSYSAAPDCRYYKGSFLDLNDGSSGLLVTFSRDISIRLCTNETNVQVRLEFELYDEDRLDIVLHEGDEYDVLDYPVDPVVGTTETLKTVSKERVALLKNRDYDYLKQVFNYPFDRDFNITVSSDAVSASLGAEQPLLEDIYARKVEGFILGEDYSQERVLMTLTVW